VPDQVEVLGQVGPPQLSLSGLRVWPYVVRCLLLECITSLNVLRRRRRRVSYTPRPNGDTKLMAI
jgi:hypothetical protein